VEHLGFNKTLVGVDVVTRGEPVAQDAGEARILELIAGRPAAIIVTPIGGQGCLFGRGNQPISSRVITRVGRENIHVVSTPEKIHSLEGRPLWVDTGDPETDGMLRGYVRVLTGYREEIVIRISS
jgi:predicted polyphosphate/ATP-dependent NAD kinase